ncbi:transmembrane glucosamine N-acetyltransferase NagX [Colwelliaceae bacterium BS250]
MNPTSKSLNLSVSKPKRLLSIDALRGFDMFWILGAEGIFAALFIITGFSFFDSAAAQMLHSQWHGFTLYDLIFPLFIFLSGVSLGIAAKPIRQFDPQQRKAKYQHACKRLFLLIVLGVFYNHGWGTGIPAAFDEIRYVSVLGRIGIAWFIAAMIVWHCQFLTQVKVTLGLFFGYWLILAFASVGDYGAGNYGMDYSINAWVDQTLMPGIRYQNLAVDPEGLLSNLGSIVNCLAGVFVGRLMMQQKHIEKVLLRNLILTGVGTLALGWGIDIILPVNKTLWTPSFVLVTCGWSILFLALFYWLIDMLCWQKWAKPFAIIGMNSIIIYLGTALVDWQYLAKSLFGGVISASSEHWQILLTIIAVLLLQWLLLAWMYRNKIFIKV